MKRVGHGGAADFLLSVSLLVLVPGLLPGASALPKYGFSVSSDTPSCGIKNQVLVLPPLSLNLSGESPGNRYQEVEKIVGLAPEDGEVFLRLRLQAGGLTGQESEKVLTDRVTQILQRMPLEAAAVDGLLVEIEEPLAAPELVQFALANIAVKAKASKANLRLAFFFPPGFIGRHGDLLKRVAIYSDALGTVLTPGWRQDMKWVAEQALNKPLFLKLDTGSLADPEQIGAAYLEAALAASGTAVEVIWVEARDERVPSRLCAINSFLSRFIRSDFDLLAPGASGFAVAVEGVESAEHKLFSDGRSPDISILAKVKATPGRPKTVSLLSSSPGAFQTEWYDAVQGTKLAPGEIKKTGQGVAQSCDCDAAYALIVIHKKGTPEDREHTTVEVRARLDLTVEEVIARWQQYRESQRQGLDNHTASCFMNLHFESTNIGSGFDISMQFQQFSNRAGLVEWAQTQFYVNGVKFKKQREFPLPQLEPEKVMTQPLELKLDEKYAYKLLGVDQVNGVHCFVVGVEPKEPGENLYSGKIWIDGTKFRQVKMELRQRGAKSNVVANVETQNYELVPDGKGREFNLIHSIYAQQTLNAAGRNFILQKTYRFSDYAINTGSFEAALSAARLSDNPMYRETETGLRVLRKQGDQRVLQAGDAKRVRSIIGGVLYEGTFNFPIPLFGISLVDFNFRKTDSQLSVFFAGPILAANLSKQWQSKFRVGLDLALSGLPENNRVYAGNRELKTENLWVFEEVSGVRGTWQATTSLSFTGSSHFAYHRFRATGDSDKQYLLPRNGMTLLPGAEIKYARQGYMLTASAFEGRRLGWKEFGFVQDRQEPFHETFTRYSADFSKSLYLGRFTKAGFDFAYYGGDRLDRFSRYRPSFFSRPRIRGIPNGADSFDAIGIGSVNYGFNVLEFIKFEGFYNYARVRNKTESRRFREFDGLELDFGTAGPWSTYLQGTVTYALRGNLERYNSRWGVYFMIFKPLR